MPMTPLPAATIPEPGSAHALEPASALAGGLASMAPGAHPFSSAMNAAINTPAAQETGARVEKSLESLAGAGSDTAAAHPSKPESARSSQDRATAVHEETTRLLHQLATGLAASVGSPMPNLAEAGRVNAWSGAQAVGAARNGVQAATKASDRTDPSDRTDRSDPAPDPTSKPGAPDSASHAAATKLEAAFALPQEPAHAPATTTVTPPVAPAARPPPVETPTWQGAVMPHAANLRIDVTNVGDLALHLRMADGAANLRVEGSAAPVFAARESDLRLELARNGVTLNQLEVAPTPVTAARDSGSATSNDAFGSGHTPQDNQRESADREGGHGPVPAKPKGSSTPRHAGRVNVQV
jgi:hypothetical protein